MGKHKRKRDSIEGKVDDVKNAEPSNIDNDSEYVTKSKKKKKRNMHETDFEKNGAHTENVEADPESKQHKKKKKKHLDSDNSLSENRNESLVVEKKVSSAECPRKRKRSKENDTGILNNGKSQTENSTDQNGRVDEIDTEAPKKKKKKKKKNKNKESLEEVNEYGASSEVSAAISNDNCDIDRKNVESEVADTATEANKKSHKKKKKKSKCNASNEEASEDDKTVDECQKDNENGVSKDGENDKFTDIKSKKKKKSKESKEIDNSEKVENSLASQNDTVNSIHSPREHNQEHKDKNTSNAITGQWDTNAFGDEAKQNKFLRLLGGFKKGADTSSIQKRIFNDKNSSKETSTSPSRFGGSLAMNKSQQEEYKKAMETEYNSAVTSHFNRGIGLGFQKPEPKKTFSIDTQKSKSIKFDDSD